MGAKQPELSRKSPSGSQLLSHLLPVARVLSKMSALQLLQALEVNLSGTMQNSYKGQSIILQGTFPRRQKVAHELKPTTSNSDWEGSKSIANGLHIPTATQNTTINNLHSNNVNYLQGNVNKQHQHVINTNQRYNTEQYNSQQQISPLYMMSSGQSLSHVSSIQKPTEVFTFSSGTKLFNPDTLMQRLMSSTTSNVGTGIYNLKQNVFPDQLLPQAYESQKKQLYPTNQQKSVSFIPNSIGFANVNFTPNALLMPVGSETSKFRGHVSYDADKINNYQGKFKPGQMFPTVNLKAPSASGRLLFNADILNKMLMRNAKTKQTAPTLTPVAESALQADVSSTIFDSDMLFPGLFSISNKNNDYVSMFNARQRESKPNIYFSSLDFADDVSRKLENETIGNLKENILTQTPMNTAIKKLNDTSLLSTPMPTPPSPLTSNMSNNVFVPGQPNPIHGFVPGSLTGDGKTFQMMIDGGMYDPFKINQQTIGTDHTKSSKQNTSLKPMSNGFHMELASFNPSNNIQGVETFVSSPQPQNNLSMIYNANEVNQNAFAYILKNANFGRDSPSKGMFDNSQFLGSFDPTKANFDKSSNGTGALSSFGGMFNPSEVNRAYFNPDKVNREKMNFNPSNMLHKNPGYNETVAESYEFDPNKVNKVHMFFTPPFLHSNKTSSDNSTQHTFVPGLLTGGSDGRDGIDPGNLKTQILFNPIALLHVNISNDQRQMKKNSFGLQGDTKDKNSKMKFDPRAVNKYKVNFNPYEMMKQIMGIYQQSEEREVGPFLGHGHHDSADQSEHVKFSTLSNFDKD